MIAQHTYLFTAKVDARGVATIETLKKHPDAPRWDSSDPTEYNTRAGNGATFMLPAGATSAPGSLEGTLTGGFGIDRRVHFVDASGQKWHVRASYR